jgi:hypothetical protein
MIAHMSIPSIDPRNTALFFAAIIDGTVFAFPVVPGAMIAVARDGSGSAVEVYPPDMKHHPGRGDPDPTRIPEGPATMPWEDQVFSETSERGPSAFHLAIGTRLTEGQIKSLAESRGWRSVSCDRGGAFGVVEVWVDNQYLVEVLVPEQVERYRAFMNPEACSTMFGPAIEPDEHVAET